MLIVILSTVIALLILAMLFLIKKVFPLAIAWYLEWTKMDCRIDGEYIPADKADMWCIKKAFWQLMDVYLK